MTDERHVVLAKPGDLLILTVSEDVSKKDVEYISRLLQERAGMTALICNFDIKLSAIDREARLALIDHLNKENESGNSETQHRPTRRFEDQS